MREVKLDEWQEVRLQPPRAPPLSQAPVGELLAQEEVRRFSQLMSWQLQRGRGYRAGSLFPNPDEDTEKHAVDPATAVMIDSSDDDTGGSETEGESEEGEGEMEGEPSEPALPAIAPQFVPPVRRQMEQARRDSAKDAEAIGLEPLQVRVLFSAPP